MRYFIPKQSIATFCSAGNRKKKTWTGFVQKETTFLIPSMTIFGAARTGKLRSWIHATSDGKKHLPVLDDAKNLCDLGFPSGKQEPTWKLRCGFNTWHYAFFGLFDELFMVHVLMIFQAGFCHGRLKATSASQSGACRTADNGRRWPLWQ